MWPLPLSRHSQARWPPWLSTNSCFNSVIASGRLGTQGQLGTPPEITTPNGTAHAKSHQCLLNMSVKYMYIYMCLMMFNEYLNLFPKSLHTSYHVDKNMMKRDETNMCSLVEGAIVLSFLSRCHGHDYVKACMHI